MKNIILNQRAERDELMARPYQQRDTRYNFDELLSNPLIKLITGPRRVGKSVFALLMLQVGTSPISILMIIFCLKTGTRIW